MFGFLKKKLKEAVDKVSNVLKEENQAEPTSERVIKEPVLITEGKKPIIQEEVFDDSKLKKEDITKELEEEVDKKSSENKDSDKSQDITDEIEKELEKEIDKIEEIKESEEIEENVKEALEEDEKKIIDLEHQIEEEKEEIKQEHIEEIKEEAEKDVKEILENEKELHKIDIKDEETNIHLYTEKDKEIESEVKDIHDILKEEIRKRPEEVKEIEKKNGIFSVFKKVTEKKLSEDDIDKILKELNKALLENDVAFIVAEKICDDVKKDLINKIVSRGKIESLIKDALKNSILNVLSQGTIKLDKAVDSFYDKEKEPFTIMFLGFNGVGKTTTLAKFAKKMHDFKPVIAAADTFRAASIEQLEEHGRRLNFEVVKHDYGSDAAAVIFDAKKHASAIGSKLVLADTAGRSHANSNLMDELKKIVRVNKPNFKILVLDSLTGNDIYEQAKLFDEAVGVDGIILTKADVYEKGASLSAAYTIKKPILFFGIGQDYDDLKDFNPEEIVSKLID